MKCPSTGHCGSVLVVVLWASLGLVSIALIFGHSMLMSYRGIDNDLAGRQAEQAIEGAIRYAQALLEQVQSEGSLPELISYEGEAVVVGDAQFWFIGRGDDLNGTTREFGLTDEAARLNLNVAPAAVLALLPGMTEDLAAAIVAWRTPQNGGIPSDTEKGGPFESVDELALIPGMTREILYGEDTNANGVLDPNEDDGEQSLPADNSDGRLDAGLAEYCTVFTREPVQRPSGEARVNLSTLSQQNMQPLYEAFAATFPEKPRPNVIARAYTSALDFFANSGIQASLQDDEFDQLLPALTWNVPGAAAPGIGLVNVNTASAAVLNALDGGSALGDSILAERSARPVPSIGFAWAARVIPPDSPAALFLTGLGFQTSIDVAAVGRHGRGYRRSRVVYDRAGEEKQIVYRRNLAPLGWALGSDIREQLALKRNTR